MTNIEKNISNKSVIIACDLFLNLKLYSVPDWLQESIKCDFPNVILSPVNTPDSNEINKDASIYWGNRVTMQMIDKMPNL